ncbi:MAG TPA: hypothetical protein VHT70_00830 [Candidatus Saccharimonadales bacterium]|jgi:hypothetical protein|nr:hypothetical protein [Candidatus Saccharimonadales bacterium]
MFSAKKNMPLKDYFEAITKEILYNTDRYPDSATINESAGFSEQELSAIKDEQPILAFVYLFLVTKELQARGKIASIRRSIPQEEVNRLIGEAFGYGLVVTLFKQVPTTISQSDAADRAEAAGQQLLAHYSLYLDGIETGLGKPGDDPYFLGFEYFKSRVIEKAVLTNEKDFALLMLSKFIKNNLVKDLVEQITAVYKLI